MRWSDVSRERVLNLLIAESDAAVRKDQQTLSWHTPNGGIQSRRFPESASAPGISSHPAAALIEAVADHPTMPIGSGF
jgi:hypothetical protein